MNLEIEELDPIEAPDGSDFWTGFGVTAGIGTAIFLAAIAT